MTRTPTRIRRAPVRTTARIATPVPRAEFEARLRAGRIEGRLPDDALDPGIYDDWDDAEDLMRHYVSAAVEPLGHRDIAGERRRAKARKKTTVRTNSAAAHDAARQPRTRKAESNIPVVRRVPTTRAAGTPTRAAPTFAQLFRPGISLGPPLRYIGVRFITPEIDISEARFRRQRAGIGKCTGGKLTAVRRAYAFAYVMLESAKEEVRAIKRSGTDARVLWHAYMEADEARLSHWFGENYSQQEVMTLLHKIDDMLSEWSMAFCGGFRDILPVFIRCKSKNGVGDGPARHIVKNTIELFPRYFDMPPARQAITMLHEMGHRCKSLLKPRDESHDLCSGGWKRSGDMCYRDTSEVNGWDDLFSGGNPRILAEAATRGNGSARTTLLNNIDNYLCYMWNRYADHGERTMYLLTEGAKQAKPASSGHSKPVN
jgi:hypothetical protein